MKSNYLLSSTFRSLLTEVSKSLQYTPPYLWNGEIHVAWSFLDTSLPASCHHQVTHNPLVSS